MNRSGRAVAVTGAQGYIGAELVTALLAGGADVLRVSSRPLAPLAGACDLQGRIDDPATWARIVIEADTVFHLAGNTSVYAAADDPAASLNSTVLPLTLLTAAARAQGRCPRVVHASTATLYGLNDAVPIDERVPPRPVTNYDLHKLFAEQQLQLASAQGIVAGVSLRLANVYGPSSAASSAGDRGILNRVARQALAGEPISAFGGGDYLRDYVFIDDVVAAFAAAGTGERAPGDPLIVATGRSTTVAAAFELVAERAARITGRRVAVADAPWPAGADRIEFRNFTADIAAIRDRLDWTPAVSLEDGVDRLVAAAAATGHTA